MSTPTEPSPPFAPDDPRLSEWIDGRLSAAEAAAVEQVVGRSPELTRLVADLRAIKAAARATPAASPPAGFADRVLAAVVADRAEGGGEMSDRLVEAEWRAIEAGRIAEERAEAAADLAEEIAPSSADKRPPWPWLSLAAALAAGVLLTVALNFPSRGPDENQVALLTEREAEPMVNRALREAAESETAAAPAPAAAVAPREPQRPAAERRSRARADGLAEPIEVMVRGPAGRANLLQRLTALGIVAVPSGPGPGGELLELVGPGEAVAAFLTAPLGEQPPPEEKRLAGGLPAPGEPALLASEARDGEAKPAWSDRRPGQRSAKRIGRPEGTSGEPARATPAPTAVAVDAVLARGSSESLRAPATAAAPAGEAGGAADPAAAPSRRILIRVIELPAVPGEPSQHE